MPDYIPTSDADFDNWLGLFAAYVTANAAALGLTPQRHRALDRRHHRLGRRFSRQ